MICAAFECSGYIETRKVGRLNMVINIPKRHHKYMGMLVEAKWCS